MGYYFRLETKGLLYAPPTVRIAYTMAFVTPVMEHWLKQEIAKLLGEIKGYFVVFFIFKNTILPKVEIFFY